MTIVATLCCLRVSELVRLKVYNLLFDHFTGMGVPGYDGACGVNDSARKGQS